MAGQKAFALLQEASKYMTALPVVKFRDTYAHTNTRMHARTDILYHIYTQAHMHACTPAHTRDDVDEGRGKNYASSKGAEEEKEGVVSTA